MSEITKEKPRLGKGLEALFQNKSPFASGRTVMQIPIQEIVPNPYQPRFEFNEDSLKELATSIKNHGVAQPILVRKGAKAYELIAGERRLRATEMAGLDSIPAIIKDISDLESMQLALIENIDREDLSPIEEAKAFQRLLDEFGMSHQELADQFGRSRSAITNTLRLLKLPHSIQKSLMSGEISEGHARALLSLKTIDEMESRLNTILEEETSVRDLEAQLKKETKAPKRKKNTQQEVQNIEAQFKKQGLKLKIKGTKRRGSIEVVYTTETEFQDILARLKAV